MGRQVLGRQTYERQSCELERTVGAAAGQHDWREGFAKLGKYERSSPHLAFEEHFTNVLP